MHARSSEGEIDWDDVVEATFVLQQTFRYDYPGPIADLHHRLMVVPRERHGDQQRLAFRLEVEPEASTHESADAFGNSVVTFFARRVERAIDFMHWSLIKRAVAEHRVSLSALDDEALRMPTQLTACDAALRDAAKTLLACTPPGRARADAINAYVHEQMRYRAETTVETSAAEAFTLRAGVCQDYAHVFLALARRCGISARYVSGHLLGEGGTHAWVEVLLQDDSDTLVLAYDPTHGCRVDMRYVVVAIGRDYADVAPTSGVFTAPYNGVLTATKRVGLTNLRYAAEPRLT